MTSPRLAQKKSLLTSISATTSPRRPLFDPKEVQTASPKLDKVRLTEIIPSSVAGQVKLFNDLASPLHKHTESPLNSKFLSTSLADFKSVSSSRIDDKETKSPKFVQHIRGKTLSNQEIKTPVREATSPTRNALKIRLASMNNNTRLGSLSPGKISTQEEKSPTAANILAYRDELKKEMDSSPLIKVNENAYYYETVRHLDECGQCWAQVQKNQGKPFKLNCKMANASSYRQDFPHHKHMIQGPVIKNVTYETPQPKSNVDLESTMKSSFKPFKPDFIKHQGAKATLGPQNAPLFGRTSYNSEFYNLGPTKAFIERYPQAKTVVDGVGLKGTSSYNTSHGEFFVSKGRVTRWPKKGDKSPFVDGVPFLSQTTSGEFFQPFKTSGMPQNQKNQDYTSIDAFPNQFQSTYVKDFNGKQQWKCPAKTFMENNLPPHMSFMKTGFEF